MPDLTAVVAIGLILSSYCYGTALGLKTWAMMGKPKTWAVLVISNSVIPLVFWASILVSTSTAIVFILFGGLGFGQIVSATVLYLGVRKLFHFKSIHQ